MIKIYNLLSSKKKLQLLGIIILAITSACAEIATISTILPFLNILTEKNNIENNKIIDTLNSIYKIENNVELTTGTALAVLIIISTCIRIVLLKFSSRFSNTLGADLGNKAYKIVLHQRYNYHINNNSSEIIAQIGRVGRIVTNAINPIIQAIVALVISLGIIFILAKISIKAVLYIALILTPLYFLSSRITKPKLYKNSQIIKKNEGQRLKLIQESIGSIRDVIIDNSHKIFCKTYESINNETRRSEASNQFISGTPKLIIESTGLLSMIVLIMILSNDKSGLAGAIPTIGALAIGTQKLLPQMQQIYNAWASINGSRAQLDNALSLLNQEIPEEYSKIFIENTISNSLDGCSNKPLLSICDLSFKHNASAPYVLKNINIDILHGSRIGFVGKTGSGKSTLIDLIMGLLEPTSGRIQVEGFDLSNFNKREWQKKIAHVPQSIYLSDSSVAQNIAFGVNPEEINMDRIRLAASKAQIDDFIVKLPKGYETQVGERGVRLSGGQRQRIGLARAFYKQAQMLVLDEATSALDDQTEAEIMKTINALGPEVTVLMIAHRLSTLSNCDLIVRLGDGSIKEVGTYKDIIGVPEEISTSS